MMKIFRFFGKIIGALLVPVLVISIFSSIFLLAFTTQLFNPDFYLETFKEEEFFDRLPEIAATQIRYSMTYNPCLEDPDMCENGETPQEEGVEGEGGPPSYFQALSEEDWETLLTELLPSGWLEEQLDDLVHNLIDNIRSGSGELTVAISLSELKENLTGESGVEAITQLLKNQPECTEDNLLNMTSILEGNDESGMDFLSCNPGNDFLDDFAPQIEALLRRSLNDIPEEIDLGKGLAKNDISIDALGIDLPLTVVINFGRWMLLMSPLFNILLMLVIAFLAVHSFKALRGWWGYPIAIAGLLGTGLASLVTPAANFMIERFGLDSPMPGLHEDLVDIASGLALRMLHLLFTQARNFALIVTGIGLTIIIVSSVLKGPSRKQDEDGDIPDDALGETPPPEEDQEDSKPPESAETEEEEELEEKQKTRKKKKSKKKEKIDDEIDPEAEEPPQEGTPEDEE